MTPGGACLRIVGSVRGPGMSHLFAVPLERPIADARLPVKKLTWQGEVMLLKSWLIRVSSWMARSTLPIQSRCRRRAHLRLEQLEDRRVPSSFTTLAAFSQNSGGLYIPISLTIDSKGDLFGTARAGGPFGDGAIFEVPVGSGSISILAPFTSNNNGLYVPSSLTIDSKGDLFGTTTSGGPSSSSNGAIFELPHGQQRHHDPRPLHLEQRRALLSHQPDHRQQGRFVRHRCQRGTDFFWGHL